LLDATPTSKNRLAAATPETKNRCRRAEQMADATSSRKDRRRDFKKRVLRSGEQLEPKRKKRDRPLVQNEEEAAAANAAKRKAAAEAKRQKEEQQRAQKASDAVAYVHAWRLRETTPWRFQKGLQEWWLKHWGSTAAVAKADFAIFLEYAPTIQGAAQERLRDDAKKAAAADVPETEGDDEDAATKARRKKRIRARKLVKALER